MHSHNRIGAVVTNCSFITLVREQNIVINPSDMNVILTTILAHPAVTKTETSMPLCLPGVADDGFLYFTIKFCTPNIGVIFASLNHEHFYECLAKANDIALALEQQQLIPGLTQAIRDNYITKSPIVPTSLCDRESCRIRHRPEHGATQAQHDRAGGDLQFADVCHREGRQETAQDAREGI